MEIPAGLPYLSSRVPVLSPSQTRGACLRLRTHLPSPSPPQLAHLSVALLSTLSHLHAAFCFSTSDSPCWILQKGQEPPGCSWMVLLGFRGLPLLSKSSTEPHSSLSQQPRLVDSSLVLPCPSVHTASFPSYPRGLPACGSFTEFSRTHT